MTTTDFTYVNEIEAEEAAREAEAADEAAREAAATRATLVANLRAYCDLLEDHPNLPAPASLYLVTYVETAEQARAARRGTHRWTKQDAPTAYYTTFSKVIGTGEDYRSDVHIVIEVSKEATCTRVVVGQRDVPEQPAVPAHTEDVFAWSCGPQGDAVNENGTVEDVAE